MAQIGTITQTALGASQVVNIDVLSGRGAGPIISLGIICVATGSLTYSLQLTCDRTPSPTGNWVNHDVVANQTGSIYGQIAYPVSGVRLNVTSFTSGSVNMGIVQWP